MRTWSGWTIAALALSATPAAGCGAGASTQDAWDGAGPADGVPAVFSGHCNGHVCPLDQAATVFDGLAGGWPAQFSAAIVGDTNADRYDEILIGDPLSDVNGTDNGIAYLFYGRDDLHGRIPVSNANASFVEDGWTLRLGAAVAGPGILFGHGNPAFVVGVPSWQGPDLPSQGAVVGFALNLFPVNGRQNLSYWSRDGTFACADGQAVGSAGFSIAGAGDVDGDGGRDLLVGAPLWRDREEAGRSGVYLVYLGTGMPPESGGPGPGPSLDDIGVLFHGATDDADLGRFVAGAGDVDGDGFDDFLLGGRTSYLVYGGPVPYAGRISTADLEDGTHAVGVFALGPEVAGLGDIDRDGFADFLIADHSGGTVVAHLVYGRAERYLGAVDPTTLGPGITAGATSSSALGTVLAGIGDIDGDRYDDFALGDPLDGRAGAEAGAVYVFLGGATRPSADLSVDAADLILPGRTDDDPCTAHAGWLVAGRGDVNWDGRDDFLVGSSGPGACGKLYLVYGAAR